MPMYDEEGNQLPERDLVPEELALYYEVLDRIHEDLLDLSVGLDTGTDIGDWLVAQCTLWSFAPDPRKAP